MSIMLSRGEQILEKIKDYIASAREKYCPNILDGELDEDGELFYMNGNDSTPFDWEWNGRTCEFQLFYRDSQLGFIKAYATRNDTISGVMWLNEGRGEGIILEDVALEKGDSLYLANLLTDRADNCEIWDMPVTEIDFATELDFEVFD